MKSLINKSIFIFFQFFVTERAQRYLFNMLLKLRGYNNYKNFIESGESFFFDSILSKFDPKICIDVGANIGKFTSEILKRSNATVISFEPLPEPFTHLVNLKEHWGDRLIIVNKGLGEKSSFSTIYFNNNSSSHASLLQEANELEYVDNNNSQTVEIITLDKFFSENQQYTSIDYIKIDTEGFEYDVLLGSLNTIEKFKPKFIHIEFNWHQVLKSQSLYSFASILENYHPYQLLPNRIIKRDSIDPLSNIYSYSNFVFIRKDVSLPC